MHCSNDKPCAVPGRQRGFTLLLTLLVLLVGGASVYLSARNPAQARLAQTLQKTSVALREAGVALAVYSIGDDERPGSLPCPDFDSDGIVDVNCLSTPDALYVKRLPWKTIDVARDAGRLWYAMDSDFRDNATAAPINVGLEGSVSLDGVSGYAALIIDPGDPLAAQTARPGNDVTDYLEGENADGDAEFENCPPDGTVCNDRIVGISVDELMAVVQQRALGAVESALRQFHADHGHVPYAAKFSTGGSSCDPNQLSGRIATSEGGCIALPHLDASDFPTWVIDNGWLDHIAYNLDSQCSASAMNCSGSTQALDSASGLAVVLGAAGTELAGQDRSGGSTIDDYLDSAENTDTDGVFEDLQLSASDNDVMRGFALP